MTNLRFIDLFAGLGGFHIALKRLGFQCVFASEIDVELRRIYLRNFPEMKGKVFGDIRDVDIDTQVPDHDLLCAGFPCQPFSKSGGQLGTQDETRGTLFHEILEILEAKKPKFVILENVGNFGRHDEGRTWEVVRRRLKRLGYFVRGTEHRTPRALGDWRDIGKVMKSKSRRKSLRIVPEEPSGLISPHHFGFPHHRERFFVVASLHALPRPVFPQVDRRCVSRLHDIVQSRGELSAADREETTLSAQQRRCIQHWNKLIKAIPADIELPSFPLWGDEMGAKYPFETHTPWSLRPAALRKYLGKKALACTRKQELLQLLPSYAREKSPKFRNWKIRYIRSNRAWWDRIATHMPRYWKRELRTFPPSLRKLEWNAKGGKRDLWSYVLQFRPSGLRVKRYTSSPALVAMTATQIPILGPQKRFLSRIEGLRLQGFPDRHELPESRERAFKALGNAVHVDVVVEIVRRLVCSVADRSTKARKGFSMAIGDSDARMVGRK